MHPLILLLPLSSSWGKVWSARITLPPSHHLPTMLPLLSPPSHHAPTPLTTLPPLPSPSCPSSLPPVPGPRMAELSSLQCRNKLEGTDLPFFCASCGCPPERAQPCQGPALTTLSLGTVRADREGVDRTVQCGQGHSLARSR